MIQRMPNERSRYLIERLISNSLSEIELNELIVVIGRNEMASEYSAILEKYFYGLLTQNQE